MKQYEASVPGECLENLVKEVSDVTQINVDYEQIRIAAKNDGEPGE